MDFIHRSDIAVHGSLSSYNCLVDSHWVCKITDFGLPSIRGSLAKKDEQLRVSLLWNGYSHLKFAILVSMVFE